MSDSISTGMSSLHKPYLLVIRRLPLDGEDENRRGDHVRDDNANGAYDAPLDHAPVYWFGVSLCQHGLHEQPQQQHKLGGRQGGDSNGSNGSNGA